MSLVSNGFISAQPADAPNGHWREEKGRGAHALSEAKASMAAGGQEEALRRSVQAGARHVHLPFDAEDGRGGEPLEALPLVFLERAQARVVELALPRHAIAGVQGIHRALAGLEELDLSSNRIRHFGDIVKIESLRILNLSGNLIEHIPSQMSQLTSLRRLDLSRNSLFEASELTHLASCESLHFLSLHGNPFCDAESFEDRALSSCPQLLVLDGLDAAHDKRCASERKAEWSKVDVPGDSTPQQLDAQSQRLTLAEQENQELRAELEATSQLLARKTSEWAVAEEEASRLRQELAFLKIERPRPVEAKGPTRVEEESKMGREEFDAACAGPSPTLRPACLKLSLSVLSADADRSDPSRAPSRDPMQQIEEIEHEIKALYAHAAAQVQDLVECCKGTSSLIKSLQDDLEGAIAGAKKDVSTEELISCREASSASAGRESPSVPVAQKKERTVREVTLVISKTRNWRRDLKAKIETAQDLMVLLTENMVSHAKHDSSRDEKSAGQLEMSYSRIIAQEAGTMNEVAWLLSNCSPLRDSLPKTVLSQMETPSSMRGNDGETLSAMGQEPPRKPIFDPKITRLSNDVARSKESDATAKLILNSALDLVENLEGEMEKAEATAGASNLGLQAKEKGTGGLRSEPSQSSERILQLQGELKAQEVKLRETRTSILQVREETRSLEAALRVQQNSLLLGVVESKNSTIDACNRTIARLQERGVGNPVGGSSAIAAGGAPSGPLAAGDFEESDAERTRGGSSKDKANLPGCTAEDTGENDNQHVRATVSHLSDAKARECRKQVLLELVQSEGKYVEDLSILTSVFLLPLRRRNVLSPRDVHVVSSHFTELLALHSGIFDHVSGQRELTPILSTFHSRIHKLKVYKEYLLNCASSISVVGTRKREVGSFANFLAACGQGLDLGRGDLVQLLLCPLKRLRRYDDIFSRLVALRTSNISSSTHHKLLSVSTTIKDLIIDGSANQERVLQQSEALCVLNRSLPPHTSMTATCAAWLSEKRVGSAPLILNESCKVRDASLLMPHKKATTFGKSECFLFSDFALLAAHPKKWRPSFPDESPRLKAYAVLRGAISCSIPFEVEVARSKTSAPLYGLRVTCGSFPMISRRRAISEGQEREHRFVEVIFQFDSLDQAKKAQGLLEKIAEEQCALEEEDGEEEVKLLDIAGSAPPDEDSGTLEGGEQRSEEETGKNAPKGRISMLPGTDMTKRRELSRKLGELRGAWKPPQQERLNEAVALERKVQRDGLELLPREYLDEAPRVHAVPESKRDEYMRIPLGSPRARKTASAARVTSSMKPSKSKATDAKHDRKAATTPRRRAAARRNQRHPPGYGFSASKHLNFDFLDHSALGSAETGEVHPIDLSIFKAPRKPGRNESSAGSESISDYKTRRLIGLDTQLSEYVKDCVRFEEKLGLQAEPKT